jgi:hypothetical protein
MLPSLKNVDRFFDRLELMSARPQGAARLMTGMLLATYNNYYTAVAAFLLLWETFFLFLWRPLKRQI